MEQEEMTDEEWAAMQLYWSNALKDVKLETIASLLDEPAVPPKAEQEAAK